LALLVEVVVGKRRVFGVGLFRFLLGDDVAIVVFVGVAVVVEKGFLLLLALFHWPEWRCWRSCWRGTELKLASVAHKVVVATSTVAAPETEWRVERVEGKCRGGVWERMKKGWEGGDHCDE
jgi:hypothetical protein